MLNIGITGIIYVAVEPQDGRKGIDGLAGVVRTTLGRDPASGDLFVFKNRRGDKLKILAWMGDGFALYLRRLECGGAARHDPPHVGGDPLHPIGSGHGRRAGRQTAGRARDLSTGSGGRAMRWYFAAVMAVLLASAAVGQESPKPTAEGAAALAKLVDECVKAGGLKHEPLPANKRERLILVDKVKVAAAVKVTWERSVQPLTDELTVRWLVAGAAEKPLASAALTSATKGIQGLYARLLCDALVANWESTRPAATKHALGELLAAVGDTSGDARTRGFAALLTAARYGKDKQLKEAVESYLAASERFAGSNEPAWQAWCLTLQRGFPDGR